MFDESKRKAGEAIRRSWEVVGRWQEVVGPFVGGSEVVGVLWKSWEVVRLFDEIERRQERPFGCRG